MRKKSKKFIDRSTYYTVALNLNLLHSSQHLNIQPMVLYFLCCTFIDPFKLRLTWQLRHTITLLRSSHKDIIMLQRNIKLKNKYSITQLKSRDHLDNLRVLAKDRKLWSTLVTDIYKAAKAEKPIVFQCGDS